MFDHLSVFLWLFSQKHDHKIIHSFIDVIDADVRIWSSNVAPNFLSRIWSDSSGGNGPTSKLQKAKSYEVWQRLVKIRLFWKVEISNWPQNVKTSSVFCISDTNFSQDPLIQARIV
jgi:hypothetical protein